MNYLGVVHDIASLNLKDKRSFVLFHVNVLWLHSITSVIMDTIALFVWACLADKPWLKVLLADLMCEKSTVRWLKKCDL